jgi:hypothetical protein
VSSKTSDNALDRLGCAWCVSGDDEPAADFVIGLIRGGCDEGKHGRQGFAHSSALRIRPFLT